MEVHSIGLSAGYIVARLPRTPSRTRRARLGISPLAIRGSMTFQSAASQPTRSRRSSEGLGCIGCERNWRRGRALKFAAIWLFARERRLLRLPRLQETPASSYLSPFEF